MASGQLISYIINPDGTKIQIGFFTPGGGSVEIETKDLDLGDRRNEKFLDAIKFGFDSAEFLGAMVVQVGVRQHMTQAIEWSKEYSLVDADEPIYLEDVQQARYFRLLLRDMLPFGKWKLKEIDFYGMLMGGPI